MFSALGKINLQLRDCSSVCRLLSLSLAEPSLIFPGMIDMTNRFETTLQNACNSHIPIIPKTFELQLSVVTKKSNIIRFVRIKCFFPRLFTSINTQ